MTIPENNRSESMKHNADTEIHEAGDSSLEVIDLKNIEVAVHENAAVVLSHTPVMSRGRGHDVSDPYRISRDFLNQQARRRLENNKN